MGSSKKEKKEKKDKRKRKHKSQERSRSRSRERKHKKDRKHDREEPEVKRRRDDREKSPHRSVKQDSSPPPVKREAIVDQPPPSSSGGDSSLSVEETNKLRAKLGLRPLDVPGVKTEGAPTKKEDVHAPAGNIREKQKQQALRDKLLAAKEKRRVNKILGKVKTLGESDSEDDAHAWVEKSRRRQEEKAKAEKTARMLQQMDEEFGIGDLVEKEMGVNKPKSYGSSNLSGLNVEHGLESFAEGKTTILTLKDAGVLDEDAEDTLVNVNIQDDERASDNVQNKKKLPDYKPYDESEFDEYGMLKPKQILEKYNEEIDGKKKEQFRLGAGGGYDAQHERRMREMRTEMQQQSQTLKLPELQIATEYFTPEEMSFKKVKKKVRKIRKKNKAVTADDLMPLGEEDGGTDLGSRNRRRRRHQEEGEIEEEAQVKAEPAIPGLDLIAAPVDLITDDTEAPEEDLSGVRVEEDGAALELQLALNKTRRLNSKMARANPLQQLAAETVQVKEEEGSDSDTEKVSSTRNIILNGTSEFCRSLGDIPTYGQAGNRAEEEEDELLDFERELEERRRALEEGAVEGAAPGWQEVEVMDTQPVEIDEVEEQNVMEEEPLLNSGLGAALDLAVKKGFLESEKEKALNKGNKTRIEADNYSIEDKRYDDLDDKFSRKGGGRDRYSGGMVQDFSEKRNYKPNVKLDYYDEKGHLMNSKEAFRYLSHRFHGKGSGKLKTEKRKKKLDQEQVMMTMSSTDTPLNTASMLEDKLKQGSTPYLVLSGANKMGPSSLSKS